MINGEMIFEVVLANGILHCIYILPARPKENWKVANKSHANLMPDGLTSTGDKVEK